MGRDNNASGDYSVALGRNAKTRRLSGLGTTPADGSFVFTDNRAFDFLSTADNEFSVRSTGGVRFVLGINGTTGNPTYTCSASNRNAWSCSSDRTVKENFDQVDGRAILSRLTAMPLYYWNARGTEPKVRHLGPTAQDFMAAFAVGNDEKMIGMQDADGVALAAILGLRQIVQEKDTRLAAQDGAIASLQARLDALQTEVAAQNREMREVKRKRRAETPSSTGRPGPNSSPCTR